MKMPPHFEAQLMGQALTPDEVADMCRVSHRTVYNWLRDGEIKGYLQKHGTRHRRLIPFWSVYEMQMRRADALEAKIAEGMKKLPNPASQVHNPHICHEHTAWLMDRAGRDNFPTT